MTMVFGVAWEVCEFLYTYAGAVHSIAARLMRTSDAKKHEPALLYRAAELLFVQRGQGSKRLTQAQRTMSIAHYEHIFIERAYI
jgi:hypothetical protein